MEVMTKWGLEILRITYWVQWSTKICLSSLHLSPVFRKKLMGKSIFGKIFFTLNKTILWKEIINMIGKNRLHSPGKTILFFPYIAILFSAILKLNVFECLNSSIISHSFFFLKIWELAIWRSQINKFQCWKIFS